MREASIHIKESDLILVLKEVMPKYNFYASDKRYIEIAKKLVVTAKTKSISSRSIYASNRKLEEKGNKIKLAGRSETGVFAQLLLLKRRKMHHKGLQLIEPSSPDWVNLKETCKLATEFCNEFGINIKTGYTEYLDIGMSLMKNFSIFKFKNLHSVICKHFESTQEIREDKTPNRTTMLYDLYLKKVSQKLGWEANDYKDNPDKYVCFVRAKELADKFKIRLDHYIEAQFFAMEWGDRTMIPDPHQLYGDKSIERVRKYCYEHNITIKEAKKVDFKKLKHG